MKRRFAPLVMFSAPLFLAPILVFVQLGLGADPQSTQKPIRRLLYLRAPANHQPAKALAQCDQLTVQKYREAGVTVLDRTRGDLANWLAGPGSEYGKAHEYAQYVAYAKANDANVVGGLGFSEATERISVRLRTERGRAIFGWGISLGAITHAWAVDLAGGTEIRAISLFGNGVDHDPWSVPVTVDPLPCARPDQSNGGNTRRAFLGASLAGARVTRARPGSPAERLGLQRNDTLVTAAGIEIKSSVDLLEALQRIGPGNEIEIVWQRGEKLERGRVTLADYFDAVIAKRYTKVEERMARLVGRDIAGREVRLSEFKGRVVLVEFWTTWCGPCHEDAVLIQLLWERMKDDGFVWIAVSADEDSDKWRNYVRNNRLGGIQIHQPSWKDDFGVAGFPTIFLIDKSGVVRCEPRGATIAGSVFGLVAEDTRPPKQKNP